MDTTWNYVFLGNTVRDWAIAIGIIIIAMLAIKLFRVIILGQLKRVAARTKTTVDDFLVVVLQKSLMPLAYILAIYAGLQYLKLSPRVQRVAYIAVLFVATFFIIRIITATIAHFVELAINKNITDEQQRKPTKGILLLVNVIVWVLGLVFVIDNMGYDITTIITGLGIGGIAIALAAQAILGDLFSSVVIYLDKPFEIGDYIVVDDKSGVVEHIGIKTTRIRTLNGEQLICSNSFLTNSRVHNFKRMEQRRVVFTIGVIYGTAPEKLKRIPGMIKAIIETQEGTRFDRAHFQKFAEYSLNFEIVYFVLASEFHTYMDKHQAINLAIYEQFESEGIEFAYPTQTILLNQPANAPGPAQVSAE